MSNIFDEAARSKREDKLKPSAENVRDKVPFGITRSKQELDELIEHPGSIKKNDVTEVILRLRQIHDEIENKLDDIFQKTGLSPKYIKDYLNNPQNFKKPGEWENVQRDRQAKLGFLMGGTKVESMEGRAKKAELETEKSTRDRRGKMLGSRKNWIQM